MLGRSEIFKPSKLFFMIIIYLQIMSNNGIGWFLRNSDNSQIFILSLKSIVVVQVYEQYSCTPKNLVLGTITYLTS